MTSSARSKAEKQFAATRRENKPALNEMQTAQHERAEKMAKLRALRLARDSAENNTE